ncbi:Ceramide transfer protein [Pseudolycoriella hygida]|uniref:Ceramide transfer protein n=1 Tax=Pseudolycoriella hygida TaxID=35572 RepID=A0A9Q0N541_9DIPT|nr:Ceramide transfer protein [Pseudolycoriella hygida]
MYTHEFDDCRFDVSVNNCVWYLRTESTEDRDNWIEVLQSYNGESITFRATTAGVLTTLQHCLDIINQRDESWKKKIDKEIERRRKTEDLYRKFKDEHTNSTNSSFPGPDLEEGPHSTLPEDEFFDAVESGLDKIEEDRQLRVRLRLQSQQSQISTAGNVSKDKEENEQQKPIDDFGTGGIARNHRLWPEIDEICTQQLHYARQGVGQDGNGWQLFADEGEMKMYRREQEIEGRVVDPLKACHCVKGVSAREMCHYFFMPEYRNDWETTLEDMNVLEKVSDDTLVFLQTHKRIWPASQRDALFWSHMRNVKDNVDKDAYNTWIVCNHSIDRDDYPKMVSLMTCKGDWCLFRKMVSLMTCKGDWCLFRHKQGNGTKEKPNTENERRPYKIYLF